MKHFEVYRHIRKRALIFGLPVALFALQIMAVITSLMAVIFSFGPFLLLGALVLNAGLYRFLLELAHNPGLLQLGRVFPKMISNKRKNEYETYHKLS